jgi:hypothetical protein
VTQSHGGPLRTLPHKNLFFATTNVFAITNATSSFHTQQSVITHCDRLTAAFSSFLP